MSLNEEIEKTKKESFVEGYSASDAEALGLIISRYFSWDGVEIMRAASYALEDANFHTEAGYLMNLANEA